MASERGNDVRTREHTTPARETADRKEKWPVPFSVPFANLPALTSFAKSEKERKLLDVFRSFQYPRWPYLFPPGVPKERVGIIREAMRKSFADPEFSAEFKKLMGDDASPVNGEDLERAIRELPRDPDVIQLYNKMAGPDHLPAR